MYNALSQSQHDDKDIEVIIFYLIQFRQKAEEEKANKEKAIKMIFSLIKEEDDDTLTAQLEYYKRKDLGECTEEELKKIYKYFKDMKK